VGPRAGLNTVAKRKIFCPCQESNHDRPTRSLVAMQFVAVTQKYDAGKEYGRQTDRQTRRICNSDDLLKPLILG
jgi:hypothetical protein